MATKKSVLVIFFLFLLYIFWGTEYLATKVMLDIFPPVMLAACYVMLAGVILYVFTIFKKDKTPTFRDLKRTFLIGFFLIAMSAGLIPLIVNYLNSAYTALLIGLSPMLMVTLDWIFLKGDKPTSKVAIGLLLGFLGLLATLIPAFVPNAGVSLVGILLGIFASLSWCIGALLSKGVSFEISLYRRNALQMIFGSLILFVISYFRGEFSSLVIQTPSIGYILLFLYLSFCCTILGYSIYLWLIKNVPIALVSSTAYVTPVVAAFVGVVFGGESFTKYGLIALAFIVTSVYFISTKQR